MESRLWSGVDSRARLESVRGSENDMTAAMEVVTCAMQQRYQHSTGDVEGETVI